MEADRRVIYNDDGKTIPRGPGLGWSVKYGRSGWGSLLTGRLRNRLPLLTGRGHRRFAWRSVKTGASAPVTSRPMPRMARPGLRYRLHHRGKGRDRAHDDRRLGGGRAQLAARTRRGRGWPDPPPVAPRHVTSLSKPAALSRAPLIEECQEYGQEARPLTSTSSRQIPPPPTPTRGARTSRTDRCRTVSCRLRRRTCSTTSTASVCGNLSIEPKPAGR